MMNTSDILATCSALIATLAFGQSWFASRHTRQISQEANNLLKRQVELQDRLTALEQTREYAAKVEAIRAIIRAELRKIASNNWRLFVINTGKGEARNVEIFLDGKPLLEHDAILRDEQEIKLIGPESQISYCMALHSLLWPPFELMASWDDESGIKGKYSTTLTD